MSKLLSSFGSQSVSSAELAGVSGGFKDKDYNVDYDYNYVDTHNVRTNVDIKQWGNENSATGSGSIGTSFGA